MKISPKKLSLWGITAAVYVALTLLTAHFSFGPIQFRVAEALSVLCCFAPHMGVGITLGCAIANIFSTVSLLDIVVGTLATAMACYLMGKCHRVWMMILPNIFLNGIFVGGMLSFVLTPTAFWEGFMLYGAQVALGEALVMIFLGAPLYLLIQKSPRLQKTFLV
ncbi:MAG: QueT transporter family protein [Oscillospiraceae bacterium]|nr:QueT transporter family protein [Oscillospiraceae bacterium]